MDKAHLVLTGPSGSGKSTIISHILSRFPFGFSVSHTTRQPRKGEVNGKDYFFVTTEEFESMVKRQELLEYIKYNGNYYGTGSDQLKVSEKAILMDLEYDGVMYCRKNYPNFVVVYIDCDKDVAYERLKKRMENKNREDEVKGRMKLYEKFDSIKKDCDYVIDNTHSLERSKKEIEEIISKEFKF
ncbi:guanylate kinase [Encephalitozoon intestinalis ATCC 50506]|uniref:Guanylate kinase n=1 Tax=Encephalitozoon intestinalis (strain ATCC 50506) TaxID=876142 RepID=E0S5J2_ENCIT|nr:guanylate kinase [Encephalitozoon intestinalis ATCC 50506]ADM10977.1 guanylate kinase [Encephalitozoon intestinalis ATCC 50506]UTX44614.1 guanylate kinase [Encephalitozoon intestinalis]